MSIPSCLTYVRVDLKDKRCILLRILCYSVGHYSLRSVHFVARVQPFQSQRRAVAKKFRLQVGVKLGLVRSEDSKSTLVEPRASIRTE